MIKTTLSAAGVLLLTAAPAFAAVTVQNQDAKGHTIYVNRGSQGESHQDIGAGKSAQVDCPDKCGFRVSAFTRLAGGHSQLVIDKDGELRFAGGRGDMQMPDGTN